MADRLARIIATVQDTAFGDLTHDERTTLLTLLERVART